MKLELGAVAGAGTAGSAAGGTSGSSSSNNEAGAGRGKGATGAAIAATNAASEAGKAGGGAAAGTLTKAKGEEEEGGDEEAKPAGKKGKRKVCGSVGKTKYDGCSKDVDLSWNVFFTGVQVDAYIVLFFVITSTLCGPMSLSWWNFW